MGYERGFYGSGMDIAHFSSTPFRLVGLSSLTTSVCYRFMGNVVHLREKEKENGSEEQPVFATLDNRVKIFEIF